MAPDRHEAGTSRRVVKVSTRLEITRLEYVKLISQMAATLLSSSRSAVCACSAWQYPRLAEEAVWSAEKIFSIASSRTKGQETVDKSTNIKPEVEVAVAKVEAA